MDNFNELVAYIKQIDCNANNNRAVCSVERQLSTVGVIEIHVGFEVWSNMLCVIGDVADPYRKHAEYFADNETFIVWDYT